MKYVRYSLGWKLLEALKNLDFPVWNSAYEMRSKKNIKSYKAILLYSFYCIVTGRDLTKTHFFCNGAAECRIVMQCTASSAIMASDFFYFWWWSTINSTSRVYQQSTPCVKITIMPRFLLWNIVYTQLACSWYDSNWVEIAPEDAFKVVSSVIIR